MNNLNLGKFGVQELNTKEMQEVDGGAIFRAEGLLEWASGHSSWKKVRLEIFGWKIK